MERTRVVAAFDLAALGTIITLSQGAATQLHPSTPPAPAAAVCSALEVKTAEHMGVVLLIFHQANKSDGPRLGELLEQNDGASVEFETSDGHTQAASVSPWNMLRPRADVPNWKRPSDRTGAILVEIPAGAERS